LDKSITKQVLRQAFEPFTDADGIIALSLNTSLNSATVRFGHEEDAQKALDMLQGEPLVAFLYLSVTISISFSFFCFFFRRIRFLILFV